MDHRGIDRERPRSTPKESREVRATRELFTLLERREELRGVYAPADQLADTLRWSA